MPTTDDGQGMMPLQQKDKHMGNSRFGGGVNMNDKDYSKIGGHMSAGHLDSLKDIYGQARREQLYNPVVEDSSALSMNSPLNGFNSHTSDTHQHPHEEGKSPASMNDDALYQTTDTKQSSNSIKAGDLLSKIGETALSTATGGLSTLLTRGNSTNLAPDVMNEVLGGSGEQTYNKNGRMMTDNSHGATMSREGGMYEHSDAYNEDFKNGIGTNMKNLAIGSDERIAEYNRRGWASDETTKKKTDVGNRGGNFLPTSEDDSRYDDLKQ